MNARLMFVHALSPLHAGTGQGVGVIDLPVAREKATGLPYFPGSALKGVLRDACVDEEQRRRVFGPDTSAAHEYAGSVHISDQRLLLMPVRSLAGTFAWVTSPYILRRFLRDLETAGVPGMFKASAIPVPDSEASCLVPNGGSAIVLADKRVVLEDLDPSAKPDGASEALAEWLARQVFPKDEGWQQTMRARFCVVHDDVLSFLLDTATEVFARVRLREGVKTVATGGLWYAEALPADTVLSGLVTAVPVMALADEVFEVIGELARSPFSSAGRRPSGVACAVCAWWRWASHAYT